MLYVSGTTRLKLNQGKLRKALFKVLPLAEQRRILAKLEALQAHSRRAKEALDQIPALLDLYRQSVLAAAFRGDLTRDWRAQHPDVEPASCLPPAFAGDPRRTRGQASWRKRVNDPG